MRAVAAVALCVLCGIDAGSAQAAPGFVPQPLLGGAPEVTDVHSAMNANGDLVVVWLEGPVGGRKRVAAAVRPPGGPFGAVQLIDDPAATNAQTPRVGIDALGNASAIWVGVPQSGGRAITVAQAQAGQPFGARQVLDTQNTPSAPDIAVSPQGAVLAAWLFQGTVRGLRANVAPAGKSLDPGNNQVLADGNLPDVTGGPDVAFGPNGHGAVVWTRAAVGSGPRTILIATVAPGAGPPLTVEQPLNSATATEQNISVDVALDGSGRAVAVWRDNAVKGGVLAAVRPAGGNGFDAGTHQLADTSGTQPVVGMDTAGDAVAVWNGGDHIRAAFRPAAAATGDAFGAPQVLDASAGGGVSSPALGVDPAGLAAAAWEEGGVVHGAHAESGAAFGAEQVLNAVGTTGSHASVTLGGDGAVTWADVESGSQQSVGVVGIDSEPPLLTNVTVPAEGAVGVPVSFSAAASDGWGPATIHWFFGDAGLTFTDGPAVSHTYAAPGDYPVSTTATDAVGNLSASAPTTIHIAGGVAPPAPTRGVDFNASTVSGRVLVSVPESAPAGRVVARPVVRGAAAIRPPEGYLPFRVLGKDDNIPVGSILDASKGVSSITMAANAPGTLTQTGKFSQGVFRTKQSTKAALTTAVMMGGGNFRRDCRAQRAGKSGAAAARRRPRRRLFANVKGRFRTRGRNSTATVRGTRYLVKDSCRGTRTSVRRGSVRVFDLVKRRGRTVKAGKSYLARPKSALKRRRR